MNDSLPNPTPASLLSKGRTREALTLYLVSPDPDPDVRAALNTLVKLQESLREKAWQKAVSYAGALTENGGTLDGRPLVDVETLELQLTQLKQAAEQLDKHQYKDIAVLLEPVTLPLLQAEADTLRGTALIYDNETDAAKARFERALDVDPKHFRALTNLGNLALEAGNTDEAIKAYEAAIQINDDFANAHHNLGVAYRRKGQMTKSVRALRKAQGASQRTLRGEARQKLGETSPQVKRGFKWLLYGLGAVVLFLVLRSRGLF